MTSVTVDKIDKITIRKTDFEIDIKVIEDGDFEVPIPKSFVLKMKGKNNWNPDEFVRILAKHMHDNKEDRCCSGEILMGQLNKIEDEEDFEKWVYTDFYQRLTTDKKSNTVSVSGHFILHPKSKDDKRLARNVRFRKSFAKAFFRNKHIKSDKEGGGKKVGNAIYWLGDYKKTVIDPGDDIEGISKSDTSIGESVSDLKTTKFSDSIFSYDFQKYIKIFHRTKDLNHDILTDINKFKIPEAEKKLEPVKREVNIKLDEYLKKGYDVLIQGPPAVGKTRLVFDVLRESEIENCYVFSFNRLAFDGLYDLKFSKNLKQENMKLIWFIDDLHKLLDKGLEGEIEIIYENLTAKIQNISVVATTWSGKHMKGILNFKDIIKGMEELKIEKWSKEEGEDLIKLHGYSIDRMKNFDGTPFSIIKNKNIKKMSTIYDVYKSPEKGNRNNIYLMQYLKLLRTFFDLVDYNLIKDVYHKLRPQSKNTDDFKISIDELYYDGFLIREKGIVDSWDIYFVEIIAITKEDYPEFNEDIKKLISLFSKPGKFVTLYVLSRYFCENKDFKSAIACFEHIVENIESGKDKKVLATSVNNWGGALFELGKFEEAREKFEKAIEIEPDDLNAHFNLGIVLAELGKYEEACEVLEKAIEIEPKFEPEFADVHYHYGKILEKLTDDETDKKIIEIYKRAFLLFILKKEWKMAIKVAGSKILNKLEKSEDDSQRDTFFIFSIGIAFISNPDKNSRTFINKNIRDNKKNEKNSIRSYSIIIDAFLENKKPDIEVKPKSDDLVLKAAIVLANEIVSRSSAST